MKTLKYFLIILIFTTPFNSFACIPLSEEMLEEDFSFYDKNDDEHIDKKELFSGIKIKNLDKNFVKKVVGTFDNNHDNLMSFKEYKNTNRRAVLDISSILSWFNEADKDKSFSIDKNEFTYTAFPQQKILFEQVDLNSDELISFEEYFYKDNAYFFEKPKTTGKSLIEKEIPNLGGCH